MEKRKPTEKDWQKIRVLYLNGEKPRFIVQKFPELDLTAKAISTKFSKNNTKKKRDKIKQKVEEKLLDDITTQQANANKELVQVSKKIVEVVKNYLENEMYKDFAGFTKKGFFCETSETINTAAFKDMVRALCDVQKAQRLALDMDKEIQEKLPTPVINIDFGDDKE